VLMWASAILDGHPDETYVEEPTAFPLFIAVSANGNPLGEAQTAC
jgi:hypothetical protein